MKIIRQSVISDNMVCTGYDAAAMCVLPSWLDAKGGGIEMREIKKGFHTVRCATPHKNFLIWARLELLRKAGCVLH